MWVPCLCDEWQWVSLSQTAPPGIPGDLPGVTLALPSMGFLLGGPYISPLLVGPNWNTRINTQSTWRAPHLGTPRKVPAERLRRFGQLCGTQSNKGQARLPWPGGGDACLPATQVGRTWRAWQKVGTLGLRATSKNRCGAAKKRARRLLRGTLAVANLGQLQAVNHKLCRSPVHLRSSGANLQRVEGSHRAQASYSGRPGALPRGGGEQAKRPKQVGQLNYARVAREGLRVAVVCENYPESQISK